MSLFDIFTASQNENDLLRACEKSVEKRFYTKRDLVTPVDLFAFAKENGLTISYTNHLGGIEGMIRTEPTTGSVIYLAKGATKRRERFTLAHELAHWIISRELSPTGQYTAYSRFRGANSTRKDVAEEERLADLIAAELLLPRKAMESLSLSDLNLAENIRNLSRNFTVSRVTAIRRFADFLGNDIFVAELLPRRVNNLNAPAELDDAMIAFSKKSTVYSRERTSLISSIPYQKLISRSSVELSFQTMFADITCEFDVDWCRNPFPRAFVMAELPSGWQAA